MIKYFLTFFIASLFLFSNDNNDELLSVKNMIEKNYYTFNDGKLENILEQCNQIPVDNWQKHYYQGFLHLMIGKIIYNKDEDRAFDHFDKSVEHFEDAFQKNKNAEIAALLSAAYGKKSSLSGINAIFLGIKAKNSIVDAHKIDDNNSKVYLVAATHLMHLPEIYGGDKNQAEEMLFKAIKLNENRIKNKWFIDWAENAEIYAYIAQLQVLKKNYSKAEKYIKKALKIVPNYGFIEHDLKKQMIKK